MRPGSHPRPLIDVVIDAVQSAGLRVVTRDVGKILFRPLMVDTGAESTWIDAAVLEAIGIERRKKDLQFQLANGQIVTRSVGYAVLMVDKAETVDEVVFAQRGDLQLLGARALEGLNLQVDSRRKRLVAAGPIVSAAAVPPRFGQLVQVLRGSSEESRKAPDEQAEKASGYQIESTMTWPEARFQVHLTYNAQFVERKRTGVHDGERHDRASTAGRPAFVASLCPSSVAFADSPARTRISASSRAVNR